MSSDDERRDAADERQDDAASYSDPTAPPPGSWSGGTSSWTQPGSGATDAYGRPVPPPPGATQPIDPATGGTAQIPQDDGRTAPYGQSPTYGQAAPYGQSPTYGQAPPYGQTPGYGQAPPPGGPAGYGAPPYAAPQRTNTSALVLTIVSGVSILFCGGLLAIPAVVLGILGLVRQNSDPESSAKVTRWGWWAFAIGIVLSIVVAVALFGFLIAGSTMQGFESYDSYDGY